jgi:neutral ceramidase
VISLANDYAGYLPTREHHALGGYETWRARSSFLAVDAEEKLRAAVMQLLKELKS